MDVTKKIREIDEKTLPPRLHAVLKRANRRIRRILFFRGMISFLVAGLIVLLTLMAIDAVVVIYQPFVRCLLSGVGGCVVAYVAIRHGLLPSMRRFSLTRIAALIEQRHPELEERLSSAIELLAMEGGEARGSEELVALIAASAEADADTLTLERDFSTRTVKPRFFIAGALASGLAVLFLLWPFHVKLLALRALLPLAEFDNVFGSSLLVTPGAVCVQAGDALEVDVHVPAGMSDDAYLLRCRQMHWWTREVSERMRRLPAAQTNSAARTYRHVFPAVHESFSYRVRCGYALTRHYRVQVVEKPAVTVDRITYTYPAYTGRPAWIQTNALGEIQALVGTEIAIQGRLSRPDLQATLNLKTTTIPLGQTNRVAVAWSFPLRAGMDTQWAIDLLDPRGFPYTPTFYPLRAIADRPPVLTWVQPEKSPIRVARTAPVAFSFRANDDYGVTNIVLLLARNDETAKELRRWPSMQPDQEPESWSCSDVLDLSALALEGVWKVRLQIRVEDAVPPELGGPHVVTSAERVIELDDQARRLESQHYQALSKQVDETLRDVMEKMRKTERLSQELRSRVDQHQELKASDQEKLDQVRRELANHDERLATLSDELKATAFDPLAAKLEALRQLQMADARKTAEAAAMTSQEKQPDQIRAVEKKIEDLLLSADDVMRDARQFAEKLDKLAALDELATQQAQLAKQAQAAQATEQKQSWRAEQERVRQRLTQQVLERPEEQLQGMLQREKKLAALGDTVAKLRQEQQAVAQETQRKNPQEADQMAQQQTRVAKDVAQAYQKADDLRTDFQRLGQQAQQVQHPLERARQELNQAQQQTREAARQLEAPRGWKPNADQLRQRKEEWQRRQEESVRQLERAEQAVQQARQDLEKALTQQREKMAEPRERGMRPDDVAALKQQRAEIQSLAQAAQAAGEQQRALYEKQGEAIEKKMRRDERGQQPDIAALRAEVEPLQKEQQAVQQQAESLANRTEAVKNNMERMNRLPEAIKQPLRQVANELNMSRQRANEAAASLRDQPQNPHESYWRQSEAAKGFERSVAALEQTDRRLAALIDAEEAEAREQAEALQRANEPPKLRDAADEMREAARQAEAARRIQERQQRGQKPDDDEEGAAAEPVMQSAGEHAAQAADALREMVQRAAEQLQVPVDQLPSGQLAQMRRSNGSSHDTQRPASAVTNPQRLSAQVRAQIPDAEWFKLRGDAQSQAMGDRIQRVAPEYRELVRRYFLELSKEREP